MGLEENIDRPESLNRQSLQGGGDTRIARQHELGKKTARERVEAFMGPGNFMELDRSRPTAVPTSTWPRRKSRTDSILRLPPSSGSGSSRSFPMKRISGTGRDDDGMA